MKPVLHEGREVVRRLHTVHTTLCGRSSNRYHDGMNIAVPPEQVTCKFCLKAIARRNAATKTPGEIAA